MIEPGKNGAYGSVNILANAGGAIMNMMDMIIIAVISFLTVRGIFRGLTRELASIVGLIAGFYGAFMFYPRIVLFFPDKIKSGAYADILGFAVIFCGVVLAVHLLGVLIRFLLGITMLGWVDRLLGAGFGAVKGALFLGVIFFAIARFVQPAPSVIKESMLYGYVVTATEAMTGVVPDALPDTIKSKIKGLGNI
jgi:membrane protein required for colicin V production